MILELYATKERAKIRDYSKNHARSSKNRVRSLSQAKSLKSRDTKSWETLYNSFSNSTAAMSLFRSA